MDPGFRQRLCLRRPRRPSAPRGRGAARLPGGSPLLLLALLAALAACARSRSVAPGPGERPREPVVGLPCEGCEAIFEGLPAELSSRARLAPVDETGEPLRIEGTVYHPDGRPAAGIVVYAWHADGEGLYPPAARWRDHAAERHGRLRGWVASDAEGRYRFDTIRPAGYPDGLTPAHVHLQVLEPGRCTYWIDQILFDDDPRLTDTERSAQPGRGGVGLVLPERASDGTWVAVRDIVLGANVPGYP